MGTPRFTRCPLGIVRLVVKPTVTCGKLTLMTTTEIAPGTSHVSPGIAERIVLTPGVCGGKPRINGHRIKVQHVAVWHERMGMSADEIVQDHPELTLADVYSALAYYFDNRVAIDGNIRDDREFADELRRQSPSLLNRATK